MDSQDKKQDEHGLKIKTPLKINETVVDPFQAFREETMVKIENLEPRIQEQFFKELDAIIQVYYLANSLNENSLPGVTRSTGDYIFEVLYLLLSYGLIK